MPKKGTLLPLWLQGKNKTSRMGWKSLEERNDYVPPDTSEIVSNKIIPKTQINYTPTARKGQRLNVLDEEVEPGSEFRSSVFKPTKSPLLNKYINTPKFDLTPTISGKSQITPGTGKWGQTIVSNSPSKTVGVGKTIVQPLPEPQQSQARPINMVTPGSGKWGQVVAPNQTEKTVGVGKTGMVKIAPRKYNNADALVTGMLNGASVGTVNGLVNKATNQSGNMDDGNHGFAYGTGGLIGASLPWSAGAKILNPVLKGVSNPAVRELVPILSGIKNPTLRMAIESAILTGTGSAIEEVSNGQGFKPKDVVRNAAIGGTLPLAFKGASKVVEKALSPSKSQIIQDALETKFGKMDDNFSFDEVPGEPLRLTEPIPQKVKPTGEINNLGTNENVILAGGSKETYGTQTEKIPSVMTYRKKNVKTTSEPIWSGVEETNLNKPSERTPSVITYRGKKLEKTTEPILKGYESKPLGESTELVPKVTTYKSRKLNTTTEPMYSGYRKNSLSKPMKQTPSVVTYRGKKLETTTEPIWSGYENKELSKPILLKSEKVKLDPTQKNWSGTPHTTTGETVTIPSNTTKTQPKTPKANKTPTNAKLPPKVEQANTSQIGEVTTTSNVGNISDNGNKQKNMQFIDNSVQNSDVAPKEMKKSLDSQPYFEIHNEKTWGDANQKVSTNHQGAMEEFFSSDSLKSADDTALGQALIVRAIKEGRTKDANELSINLAEKLLKAGQTVQAASIFKRLTPEGMLQYANRSVARANKILKKDMKVFKKIELTHGESTKIIEGMKEYMAMAEGDAKDIKIAQIMQMINNKTPSSIVDKVRAVRNISLLGNPLTNIKNVTGNLITGVADSVSNAIGTPIDMLTSLKTGQRSVGLSNPIVLAKGFWKGTKDALSDSFGGIMLKDLEGLTVKEKAAKLMEGFVNPIDRDLASGNKFETGKRLAFNSKGMRAAENLVNSTLKVGDNSFKQAYYDNVLNQLMKSNKVKVATDEMKAIADIIAKENTYQDTNALSQFTTGIKNAPQKIKNKKIRDVTQIAVDTQLPYVKTPTNILKRAVEYSPVGLTEGVIRLSKGLGKEGMTMMAQRKAIDRISRGIVGTGIMAEGAHLAKKGILSGASDKDKDKASYDKQKGIQPYSIKKGDKTYTYDWAQPMSLPLSAGVQTTQGKKGGLTTANNVADAISKAIDMYGDQPMLTNLQRIIGNQYGKGIGERLEEAALNVPTQFVPTLVKQVAQVLDKQTRSTYDSDIAKRYMVNPILAKAHPTSLEQKYDTLGRPMQNFQGKNNVGNVMLNPGRLSTVSNSKAEQLIDKVYKETDGDKAILPRVAPESITVEGKPLTLTSKEYADYQKYIGEETNKAYTKIFEDISKNDIRENGNKSAETQAKEMKRVLDEINAIAKENFLKGRKLYVKNGKAYEFKNGDNPRN